ncbi:MAG: DUF5990 family protein, partial [Actinoplanes sp.]
PGAEADALRLSNAHVGVQKGRDPVELVSCSAASAAWQFEVVSREVGEGLLDVGGPWVHGRPGARFLYLTWGNVHGELFAGFRRAKLLFGDIPGDALRSAHAGDGVLVASLGLTDAEGGPLCARVRPPAVVWTLR